MNSIGKWLEDRTGVVGLCSTIFNATVPKTRRCCGLIPTMIVFAFLVQAITGVVLWLYYAPSAQTAWESVFYMQYILPYGWLVRGLHHFSAQVLVGMLGLYLLLTILQGKYRTPREFVFWASLALFGLSLGSCVTGDLLSWSLSGFSATKVRVSFLNLLPTVGPWLYKLAVGGADFGTLTLPRFLFLHVAACGGGFFAVLVLWKWFTVRARAVSLAACSTNKTVAQNSAKSATKSCCCDSPENQVSFWSCEAVKQSFGCLLFMGIVLFLVFKGPLLGNIKEEWKPDPTLPFESTVGAHLHSPADPADFYGGARPEWSFRALYYFSSLECFPGEKKYLPIFVIPSCLALYFLLVPFIGRIRVGHWFNMLVALGLFGSVCYMTYMSYDHDRHLEDYQRDIKIAEVKAKRAIELALAPEGIPPTGALTLLQNDPMIQGPILYKQHCVSCHPFQPLEKIAFLPAAQIKEEWAEGLERHGILAKTEAGAKEDEDPEFPAIPCENPSAPNLYRPIRAEWVLRFFDFSLLKSNDCFGNTAFSLKPGQEKKDFHGKMYDIAKNLPGRMEEFELSPKSLKKMIDVLAAEAALDGPRAFTLGEKKAESIEGLDIDETFTVLDDYGCLVSCHRFYDIDKIGKTAEGPDLTGYMSRQWMIDFVKNPMDKRFYKANNDRMPAYHLSEKDSLMSEKEVAMLVDWLRGKWYRKAAPVAADAAPEAAPEAVKEQPVKEEVKEEPAEEAKVEVQEEPAEEEIKEEPQPEPVAEPIMEPTPEPVVEPVVEEPAN